MLIGIVPKEFCDHISLGSIGLNIIEVYLLWNFSELIKCWYYLILKWDNRKQVFQTYLNIKPFFDGGTGLGL